jgi:hypothetical protein
MARCVRGHKGAQRHSFAFIALLCHDRGGEAMALKRHGKNGAIDPCLHASLTPRTVWPLCLNGEAGYGNRTQNGPHTVL